MKAKSLNIIAAAAIALASWSCTQTDSSINYAQQIADNEMMDSVDAMARQIIRQGFNAGDGYSEVWIRDYNTFIELSMEELPDSAIRHNLNVFWHFQGETGDIVDGFIPAEKAVVSDIGYKYRYSKTMPQYAAHKNTVETDQEASLIQAIYQYVNKSGNNDYLNTEINGKKVIDRMEWALQYLLSEKFNSLYGLIIGATTADWGDVQPEHPWGVEIDKNQDVGDGYHPGDHGAGDELVDW